MPSRYGKIVELGLWARHQDSWAILAVNDWEVVSVDSQIQFNGCIALPPRNPRKLDVSWNQSIQNTVTQLVMLSL